MQHSDAEAELSELASALRAHLEWAESLGTLATPPIDEEWLQARRAQYRALQVEDASALADAASRVPEARSTAGEGPAPTLRTSGAAAVPAEQPSVAIAAPSVPVPERTIPVAPPFIPTDPSSIPPGERWVPPATGQVPPTTGQVPTGTEQNASGTIAAAGESPKPGLKGSPEPTKPMLRMADIHGASMGTRPNLQEQRPQSAPIRPPAQPPREPGAPIVLSADARSRLRLLEQEVKSCTRCQLHATRTQTVFSRGEGTSGLCFVGEGPGADEDLQGYPFVGAAGQLLDRMIAAMGLERDDVYVCNIVKCRPPQNRKPQPDESDACQSYLDEQLQLLTPKVIVALGATAASGLLGVPLSITRLRGNWRLYKGRVPVMPTFHPSYLLRTPAAKREVWSDLLLVLDQLGLPRPKKGA